MNKLNKVFIIKTNTNDIGFLVVKLFRKFYKQTKYNKLHI